MVRVILIAVAVALAGLMLGGCGADDPERPRVKTTRYKPLSELSPAEREATFAQQDAVAKELFIWPEGKSGKRDVVADSTACREAGLADSRTSNANPLLQMTAHARCMQGKGWVTNPDAGALAQ